MVGLTPAELDSLNELIQIDHIYVKQQPQEDLKEEEIPTLQINVSESSHEQEDMNSRCIVTEDELHFHQASPTTFEEDPVDTSPDFTLTANTPLSPSSANTPLSETSDYELSLEHMNGSSLQKFDVDEDDIMYTLTGVDTESTLSFEEDDIMCTMTGSDAESNISLDFLEQLDIDSGDVPLYPLIDSSTELKLPFPSQTNSWIDSKQSSSLNTPEIFDDIENFLSKLGSPLHEVASPMSNNGDSDFFGHGPPESFSPGGSESSLLEDYSWEDSFTELFPDLTKI